MFANSTAPGARRRGIVLVLILGMLGLLALIGVTFATFAGQSLVNARNFSLSEGRTGPEQYFDFALGQLINDSNNPLSALRGHSLLRDMYGNDSTHRGTTAADIRGRLDGVVESGVFAPLRFTAVQPYPDAENKNSPYFGLGLLQFRTNIPTARINYQYYGLNFTRWTLRVGGNGAAQTFEVLEDDDRGTTNFSNKYHVLTLSPADPAMTPAPADPHPYTGIYAAQMTGSAAPFTPVPGTPAGLNVAYQLDNNGNPIFPNTFTLDGRYMRAFNGPGMNRSLLPAATAADSFFPLVPFNVAAYANFRANGLLANPTFPANFADGAATFPTAPAVGDPDIIGMDEDYDACDLENWFLAIQSADGQVVIPSFHRPGILTQANWTASLLGSTANEQRNAVAGVAKILRPRRVDHSPQFPDDPIPDATGKIKYDVDNDGDGVTDSVWLDLGYPVQRDAGGKMFKPLFAFMVIGQNGRMPLNTAGNLQARDFQTVKQYNMATDPADSTKAGYSGPKTFYDAPTWDHASHLGNSVNEVNPKYALQNAPANAYSSNVSTTSPATLGDGQWSQVDNTKNFDGTVAVGINVALTQIRNLLAGTIPQNSLTNPDLANLNNDSNFVNVNGSRYYMPNGAIDYDDMNFNKMNPNQSSIGRGGTAAVPGRWGEAEGIPRTLINSAGIFAAFNNTYDVYTNPVRAGRSIYSYAGRSPINSYTQTADALDDDFDSLDPLLNTAVSEYLTNRDNIGQVATPSERMQRFVNPTDPSGTGRLVSYMNRPDDSTDFGTGADRFGRTGFFRYFRPPGLPEHVSYPITSADAGNLDIYRMAVLGYNAALGNPMIPNRTNNLTHGYESARAPIPNQGTATTPAEAVRIAVMGAMPYDLYSSGTYSGIPIVGNQANSYPNFNTTYGFTGPTASGAVNSESGPYLFGNAPPLMPNPPYVAGETQPYLPQAPIPSPNPGVPADDSAIARVVNGYPLGSLNKDEADEMDLYNPNRNDMQFGPSDLEWLYRKQDVDGSTLNSRLSKLAPISFLNPKDGQMRRRFFSVDSWEPNSFVYANDNPQGRFAWNSRFGQLASASLAMTNQVVVGPNPMNLPNAANNFVPQYYTNSIPEFFANPFAVEGLPNPTLPAPIGDYTSYPNGPNKTLPLALTGSPTGTGTNLFGNGYDNSDPANLFNSNVPSDVLARPNPASNSLAYPTMTPAIAHRDRRINLNFPLPVASDPAEPVRQKWIRETYQLLKATLPPQAVDTPQELAALSQYVVNIIDFRDPDATMTRFVNTDLMAVPADPSTSPPSPSNVQFADVSVPSPTSAAAVSDPTPAWDPNTTKTPVTFYPFDPNIALEQSQTPANQGASWKTLMTDGAGNPRRPFLVQYGMEYNPIALNEVLCYSFNANNGGASTPTDRFYIELVNTLTDDSSHDPAATPSVGSEDLSLAGWDFVIMPDDVRGRPDPITGCLTPNVGGIAQPAPPSTTPAPGNMPVGTASLVPVAGDPAGGAFPTTAIGWSFGGGLVRDFNTAGSPASQVPPIQVIAGNARPTYYVMANPAPTSGGNQLDPKPIFTPTATRPSAIMPTSFLPRPAASRPAPGTGSFYWLYLRRPANPFNPSTEMVVVDAIRFPWGADNGATTINPVTNTPTSPPTTNSTVRLFSAQRRQPYRGGHLIPGPSYTNPPFAYGYSEQTLGDNTSTSTSVSSGPSPTPYKGAGYWQTTAAESATAPNINPVQVTRDIYETIGEGAAGTATGAKDPSWELFPFHDRDFTSVAELLLVPGCPPGLFTKQFAELAFDPARTTGTPITNAAPGTAPGATPALASGLAHASPYLPDKFYYTAASVGPDIQSTAAYPNQLGGWTGTGWHKMLDFFEVPSSANGAIGLAANGENFDWARADRKPGQINLNLIIDEEVFFGLLDDPRLNIALGQYYNQYTSFSGSNWVLPSVVTQVDDLGYPIRTYSVSDPNQATVTHQAPGQTLLAAPANQPGSFPLGNPPFTDNSAVGRGFVLADPVTSGLGVNQTTIHGMKGAFADFLMLRHGGSPFLFGHGSGQIQDGNANFTTNQATAANHSQLLGIPADAPYRSLSHPDINATVMRPAYQPPAAPPDSSATLPPSTTATPTNPATADYNPTTKLLINGPRFDYQAGGTLGQLAADPGPGNYILDPGFRFPYLDQNFNVSAVTTTLPTVPQIPPIPPRRFLQIPDVTGSSVSNASLTGDSAINKLNNNKYLAFQTPAGGPLPAGGNSLFADVSTGGLNQQYVAAPAPANVTGTPPYLTQNYYLGGNAATGPPVVIDNRQHPAFRTELLQKVMNLTTVRTHQFAVWITVGFFEVSRIGTPELGVPDTLGGELAAAAGANVRYRSFFVIDRTRATGFDPYYPGDFRDCVTYRRRIE